MGYAIFQAGGRQVRASAGDSILVDRLSAQPGDEVRFEQVLMVNDGGVRLGSPTVDGAAVVGKVVGEEKGDKVVVFKFKRRKNYARKRGHRQKYTRVEIQEITG